MIDTNLPLELEDGTPVIFNNKDEHRIYVTIPSMPYTKCNFTDRIFFLNGIHEFINDTNGIKFKLRNKIMKLVDVNKPVTVGGKEAKIVHQFDNGNLAVVVDGWSEVQNYNQYGQANGEGCVVLHNVAEQIVRFYCIWNDPPILIGSGYKTKEDAEDRRGNAPDRYAGTLKLTLVDGIATSAEIV